MLPSIRALKVAVECASPCPLAAGVAAAGIANWTDMRRASVVCRTAQNAGRQPYTPGQPAPVSRNSGLRYAPQAWIREMFRNDRSEEHTSELQSRLHLVCRLLLEKKKKKKKKQKNR